MPRYRTLNNELSFNVDGRPIQADQDGTFNVAAGSRAEAQLLAAGAQAMDAFSADEVAKFRASVSGAGNCVLFGDSMTAFYHQQVIPTAVAYNAATGVMTCTYAGHNLWSGAKAQVYGLNYAGVTKPRWLPVTVIDANTYTVTLTDKPQDVPASPTAIYTHFETRLAAYSWVGMLQRRLGHRLNIIAHSAQSGDYTAQSLARLQADVLAYQPGYVLMQSPGVNDQTLTYLGQVQVAEDVTIANLKAIYDGILGAGSKLLLLTITPVASGEARAQLAIMQRVQRINAWIKSYAVGRPNVQVVDAWARIVNPTDATGLAQASLVKSTDKIHYSVLGALKVAKACEAIINDWLPNAQSTLPQSVLDSAQNSAVTVDSAVCTGGVVTVTRALGTGIRVGEWFKISGGSQATANGCFRAATANATTNQTFTYLAPGCPDGALTGTISLTRSLNMYPDPLVTGTTNGAANNGITGTIAHDLFLTNNQGATGTMTAVASIAAEPNGIGNEQIIAVSAAALNDSPAFKINTTTLATNLIPGRKYQAEVQLRIASSSWADTPLLSLLGQFQIVGGVSGLTYNVNGIEGADGTTGTASYAENQTLHIRCPVLAIPSNDTVSIARLQLIAQFGAAITNSATLTLALSRIAVWDVTGD